MHSAYNSVHVTSPRLPVLLSILNNHSLFCVSVSLFLFHECVHLCHFGVYSFPFLDVQHSMQVLASLARDGAHTLCGGSTDP